jgi:hypothetical protein
MKAKKIKSIILGLATLAFGGVNAQMTFNAQYMSRGEMRHGFGTMATKGMSPGIFISQRARIGGVYTSEKFKINFSVQDVRTWGSVANSAIDTKSLLSVYEANVELFVNKKLTVKIGRQAIAYDDERILGGLDWAMQGRRHDALVIKYQADSTLTFHAGLAYNQSSESNKYSKYTVTGNYQNFQYAWVNKLYKKFNFSFLALNNGVSYYKIPTGNATTTDSLAVAFSQTIGLRSEYKADKFNFLAYGYYQMGQVVDNKFPYAQSAKFANAFDVCAEVGFKPVKGLLITVGAEILSGTSQYASGSANKTNSFDPIFGTNHKFNGYMDYFYVGNHSATVGLWDNYLRVSYAKGKSIYSINGHYFNVATDVENVYEGALKMDANLGSEIDVTHLFNYSDGVTIQTGYSQFFGTPTLQILRPGSSWEEISNYFYVMLIVRPGSVKFPKTGLKM